jgi:hypothetical protein
VPVSMICPANVKRSTMAAQSRGSVNVFVQPENGSLELMAIANRSSFGEYLEEQFGAAPVELHKAKLVQTQKIDSTVVAATTRTS